MSNYTKNKGKKGEDIAEKFLIENGLIPIQKNYFTRYGEIDLIMKDKETLVFVEVKYGKEGKCGSPYNWITKKKRVHFIKTVKEYIYKNSIKDTPLRIDFIAILEKGNNLDITYIPNAFGEDT